MLGRIWGLRTPFSSARFDVAALVVVSLMLVAAVKTCAPSGGNTETPSGWRDFVVAPNVQGGGVVGSIEEMERVAGFAFVFPSYLPEGMDNKVMLRAWAQAAGTTNGVTEEVGASEEVTIFRRRPDSPHITIEEMAEPFPVGFPDSVESVEYVSIAETKVGCRASPSPTNDRLNPMLTCDWLVGEKGFEVYFQWTVEQAIPGYVTEEMRQDALKVVESMIVAPEHP